MKFKPTNIKGAYDCAPEQQILRNRITDVLRKNFEAYGFLPIETANLNYLELLQYKYNEDAEIVREIYKIKDQGDRDLGLRFDLTVPFCKFIAMNRNLKMPFKRYEIGKVWRNGPVKAGRVREFYQCDIDAVGISGVHIEAEMIALAIKCFLDLGIEPVVKIGNRKRLADIILNSGVKPTDIENVIAIIDKLEKFPKEEIESQLSKFMTTANRTKLLDHMSAKKGFEDAKELEQELVKLDVAKHCIYSPNLARGLNIYTGTIWEIFDKAGRITSSLGGGGRYDTIIGNFIDNGFDYPAVGMSFGLEPILAVLNQKEIMQSSIDLMLIPLGTEAFCQKYADKLRAERKKVLVYLGGKTMAKAFEYAAANSIKQVAVIGADEVKGKQIVIKEISK